jgi:hypothetical protein
MDALKYFTGLDQTAKQELISFFLLETYQTTKQRESYGNILEDDLKAFIVGRPDSEISSILDEFKCYIVEAVEASK